MAIEIKRGKAIKMSYDGGASERQQLAVAPKMDCCSMICQKARQKKKKKVSFARSSWEMPHCKSANDKTKMAMRRGEKKSEVKADSCG